MALWQAISGTAELVVFLAVAARLLGLVVLAPIFGSKTLSWQLRLLLTAALALLTAPSQFGAAVELPRTLIELAVLLGGELLIGLALGAAVVILFSGVEVAGGLIGQASGLGAAELLNAESGEATPAVARLLGLVATAVFVAIGGHRLVMTALLDSFVALPPGSGVPTSLAPTLSTLVAQSFELAARAAAPVMTALVLASLALGLVSRAMPQLNVLVLGFGGHALVGLGVLAVALGAAMWAFEGMLEPMLAPLVQSFSDVTGATSLVRGS